MWRHYSAVLVLCECCVLQGWMHGVRQAVSQEVPVLPPTVSVSRPSLPPPLLAPRHSRHPLPHILYPPLNSLHPPQHSLHPPLGHHSLYPLPHSLHPLHHFHRQHSEQLSQVHLGAHLLQSHKQPQWTYTQLKRTQVAMLHHLHHQQQHHQQHHNKHQLSH